MSKEESYEKADVDAKVAEYHKRVLDIPSFNKEEFVRGIKWVYSLVGLPEPKVVLADSPLSAQYIANLAVREKLKVEDGLDMSGASINELQDMVKKGGLERDLVYYDYAKYLSIIDYGLAAYWDLREAKYGITDNQRRLRDFILSGQFDMIEFDDFVVAVMYPKRLKLEPHNGSWRHHSLDGPTIAWKDGFEQYNIWGVEFDPALYEKITKGTISAKEVTKLQNIEQRMVALKALGSEAILRDLDAKLVENTRNGLELFAIQEGFNRTQFCLKYKCPSTQREYISYVAPDVVEKAKKGDKADTAMAWKHKVTLEQYRAMVRSGREA